MLNTKINTTHTGTRRALTWAHFHGRLWCGFQFTFELVHVLKEHTIVRVVVLYLECVESLSEQHTATQCHNVDTSVLFVTSTTCLAASSTDS